MADVSMVDPQVQLFDDAPTANDLEVADDTQDDAEEEGEDGGDTEDNRVQSSCGKKNL